MSITVIPPTAASPVADKEHQWFSEMISTLEADHFNLKNDLAPDDTRKMYHALINNNQDQTFAQMKEVSSSYFIRKTLLNYLDELNRREVKLQELAFDLSRSKILVWAEVADDDEATTNQLIMAEAVANAACDNNDFSIATTVVEGSDNIRVPPQYQTFNPFNNWLASYNEHITQAKSNLTFLQHTNATCRETFWDWQTTICFYVSVHLVNAHLAAIADLHYRTHDDVSKAINPANKLSVSKLPEDIYIAYINLQMLSRRSRYLISDHKDDRSTMAHHTSDKFFARAVRNLDHLMNYMNATYRSGLPAVSVTCTRLQSEALTHFSVT